MNCRKDISKDVSYDNIARMPYRSRNPVYSPTPPLLDTHNDSGYSTRMYGSSKGASPSLSGKSKTPSSRVNVKRRHSDAYFGLLDVTILSFNLILLLGKDDATILYIGNEVYLLNIY